MKARHFVRPDERVIVIFTRGGWFDIRDDQTGSTGTWVIDPARSLDRVIVYHRDAATNANTVYLASFVEAVPTGEDERFRIEFAHIQYAGQSTLNWRDFAETGTNPIRYLP